jgi:hypothetical protein
VGGRGGQGARAPGVLGLGTSRRVLRPCLAPAAGACATPASCSEPLSNPESACASAAPILNNSESLHTVCHTHCTVLCSFIDSCLSFRMMWQKFCRRCLC